jgi:hypothetical protein
VRSIRSLLLPLFLTLSVAMAGPAWALDPAAATASIDGFQQAVTASAADAEDFTRLAVLALVTYQRDAELSYQMFSLLVEDDDRAADPSSPTGYVVVRSVRDDLFRLASKPEIGKGYCGGSREKGYADADTKNCAVRLDKVYSSTRQGVGYPNPGRAKLFVVNTGAHRPRPVELIDVGGTWRLRNWGALLQGVAGPSPEP